MPFLLLSLFIYTFVIVLALFIILLCSILYNSIIAIQLYRRLFKRVIIAINNRKRVYSLNITDLYCALIGYGLAQPPAGRAAAGPPRGVCLRPSASAAVGRPPARRAEKARKAIIYNDIRTHIETQPVLRKPTPLRPQWVVPGPSYPYGINPVGGFQTPLPTPGGPNPVPLRSIHVSEACKTRQRTSSMPSCQSKLQEVHLIKRLSNASKLHKQRQQKVMKGQELQQSQGKNLQN